MYKIYEMANLSRRTSSLLDAVDAVIEDPDIAKNIEANINIL